MAAGGIAPATRNVDALLIPRLRSRTLANKRAQFLLTSHAVRVKLNKLGGNMRGVVAFLRQTAPVASSLKNALDHGEICRGEWFRIIGGCYHPGSIGCRDEPQMNQAAS
ncbi:hypothetical protein CYG48_05880 [Neorhizobium sp. SOG26]|uniref:hypothetical protein n=1 Tax=Neorhizobium sp. SOG26 TaxID=2060726 RepID=UPI000E574E46|nr:hypothetical protein [Neorhizobium sp. SOG26]AXV15274.1 hypothetical protein CYG48_05880 [Neorhizobium sp. SOG26]